MFVTFLFLDFAQLLLVLLKVRLECDTIDEAAVVERFENGCGGEQVVLSEQGVQTVNDYAAMTIGQLKSLAKQVDNDVLGQHSAHVALFLIEQVGAYAQLATCRSHQWRWSRRLQLKRESFK